MWILFGFAIFPLTFIAVLLFAAAITHDVPPIVTTGAWLFLLACIVGICVSGAQAHEELCATAVPGTRFARTYRCDCP